MRVGRYKYVRTNIDRDGDLTYAISGDVAFQAYDPRISIPR